MMRIDEGRESRTRCFAGKRNARGGARRREGRLVRLLRYTPVWIPTYMVDPSVWVSEVAMVWASSAVGMGMGWR